jgi:hypothetical protein
MSYRGRNSMYIRVPGVSHHTTPSTKPASVPRPTRIINQSPWDNDTSNSNQPPGGRYTSSSLDDLALVWVTTDTLHCLQCIFDMCPCSIDHQYKICLIKYLFLSVGNGFVSISAKFSNVSSFPTRIVLDATASLVR